MLDRPFAVCGTICHPFDPATVTAHETQCYEAHPDQIPEEHKAHHANWLKHKASSRVAKRAVETKLAKYKRWPTRAGGHK